MVWSLRRFGRIKVGRGSTAQHLCVHECVKLTPRFVLAVDVHCAPHTRDSTIRHVTPRTLPRRCLRERGIENSWECGSGTRRSHPRGRQDGDACRNQGHPCTTPNTRLSLCVCVCVCVCAFVSFCFVSLCGVCGVCVACVSILTCVTLPISHHCR